MLSEYIMSRALLLMAMTLSFAPRILGNPLELSKRLVCNHDNCLNSLLRNSAQASTFCYDYAKNLPLPPASYTSVCKENPTAVASACSCFSSLQTTTTTTTTTTTPTGTPTPPPCDAAHNYGYTYEVSAFDFKSLYIYFNLHPSNAFGDCCKACFATPGCYGFDEGVYAGSGGPPYTFYCELGLISAGTFPGVSATCPRGRTQADAGPFGSDPPGALSGAGLGPCGLP